MNFSWPHKAAEKAAHRRAGRRAWAIGITAVATAAAAGVAVPAIASTASSHGAAKSQTAHSVAKPQVAAKPEAAQAGAHAAAKHATTTTESAVTGYVDSKLTLAAKVKGGSTPTGWVKFTYGGKTLCSASLSGGNARCAHVFGSVGSFKVEAYYEGNSSHKTSSAFATVKVLALHTTTTVTTSADPAAGEAVTLNAVVSPATATGTVTFSDAAGTLGSAKVVDGTASYLNTWDATGAYAVTGTYSGDSTHLGSSGTTTVTVALGGTTTEITNPFPTYEPVDTAQTVNVEVLNNNPDGPAPTGTVTVTTDAPGAYNVGLPPGTVYSCTVDNLAPTGTPGISAGSCEITGVGYGFIEVEAIYNGNTELGTSTSTGEHKFINLMPTTTTVAPDTGTAGEELTLVGTVEEDVLAGASDPGFGPANSDTITFTVTNDTDTVVAGCDAVALAGDGDPTNYADCPVTLPAGTYTVTANFPGDEYAAGSTGTETLTIS